MKKSNAVKAVKTLLDFLPLVLDPSTSKKQKASKIKKKIKSKAKSKVKKTVKKSFVKQIKDFL